MKSSDLDDVDGWFKEVGRGDDLERGILLFIGCCSVGFSFKFWNLYTASPSSSIVHDSMSRPFSLWEDKNSENFSGSVHHPHYNCKDSGMVI